jgi:DNA ligase (NAD+)
LAGALKCDIKAKSDFQKRNFGDLSNFEIEVFMSDWTVQDLARAIEVYRKQYYSGRATIPDAAYDALEQELSRMSPGHALLSKVGVSEEAILPELKVTRLEPMLSLEKSYNVEDLVGFIGARETVFTPKIDGMALALEYDARGILVRASTRGNGLTGENVTEKVQWIPGIPKKISPNLPRLLEIRGEVYFPLDSFENFKYQFDSFRNAVPGTFGRKDVHQAKEVLAQLKFFCYDAVERGGGSSWRTHLEKCRELENLGFDCGFEEGHSFLVQSRVSSELDFLTELTTLVAGGFSKKYPFSVDGLVFRYNDQTLWNSLGNTAHHPRGSLAFKQAGESVVTQITAIEHFINRSGRVSFRAKLNPVQLSGAKISYATLHNAEFIEKGNYAPGAEVRVVRSGEVIPYIVSCEKESPTPYELPKTCPCGFDLERVGMDLVCNVQTQCSTKDLEILYYFASQMDFVGVSEKSVQKFHDLGLIKEPADFYKLTESDLLVIEGFGEKSAKNVINSIQQRAKPSLAQFLTSLGLKRGGVVKCTEVAKRFGTLEAVLHLKAEDLAVLPGWATKSSQEFVNSLQSKRAIIDALLHVVQIQESLLEPSSVDQGNLPFEGVSICISGELSVPRTEASKLLSSLGAKMVSKVSQKTSFLLCNGSSTGSKAKEAKSLGVEMISEEELEKRWAVRLK